MRPTLAQRCRARRRRDRRHCGAAPGRGRGRRRATRLRAKEALRRATDLYRGDLLSGGTPGRYFWADERGGSGLTLRESFQIEHRRAVGRLAQLYLEDGEADLAIPLFKRLLAEEPALEDVVRDLMRCYEALGDLELVERAESDLRGALAQAYGRPTEPVRATTQLLNEVRARLAEQKSAA